MPAPEQSWVHITKDIVARLELCAKMNLQHAETPVGCSGARHQGDGDDHRQRD